MTNQFDHKLIACIAKDIIAALAEDSDHTPHFPDLRVRFSATSEEVRAGVRVAQGELIRMAAMLDSNTNPATREIAPPRASQGQVEAE